MRRINNLPRFTTNVKPVVQCIYVAICLVFSTTLAYTQPINDSCVHHQELLLPPLNGLVIYQGNNIGATPQLPSPHLDCSSLGGLFSGLGADVWYSFTSYSNTCLAITVEGLENPEFNILEGNSCSGGYELLCESGANGIVSGEIELSLGQNYLFRISSGVYSDQGEFSILLEDVFCESVPYDCLLGDLVTFTPPPVAGRYSPGQEVEICYTITEWNDIEDNWIHGVQIEHGEGWDLLSLYYDFIPPCQGNGIWSWYDYWTNCEGEVFGPGFAFETFLGDNGCFTDWQSPEGYPPPGDNFGDGDGGCDQVPPNTRTFCWNVRVKNCDELGEGIFDLGIDITVLGDGTSGSWTFDSCDRLPDENINLVTQCYNCDFLLGSITEYPISCPPEEDGYFEVSSNIIDLDFRYNVSVFDLNDNLLYYYPEVSLPFTSPSELPLGYYGVTVATTEPLGDEWCNDGFYDIIHILEPFEVFAEISDECLSGSVQLTGRTWPVFEETSYRWSGPGGFTSFEQNPMVIETGVYYCSAQVNDCVITDSVIVEEIQTLPLEVGYWSIRACDNSFLRLYAIGAGENPSNYQWLDAVTGQVLSPVYIPEDNYWAFGEFEEDLELELVGFNDQGCSDTIAFLVNVIDPPPLDFSTSLENCESSTVELTVNFSDPLDEIFWLDIEESVNPRIFTDLEPGETLEIPVRLSYQSLDCEYNDLMTIVGPGLSILAPDTVLCPSDTVVLTASPSDTYLWSTGDTTQFIEVAPLPGVDTWYNVMTTDFYGCDHVDSVFIVSENVVDAEFTSNINELLAQFTPISPYDPSNTYTWDFGDGNYSNEYSPTHMYSSAGGYTVTLTVEHRCGLAINQLDVNVIAVFPNPVFSIVGDSIGCTFFEVQFENQSMNTDSVLWVFEGGNPSISNEQNPLVSYSSAGSYTVTLVAFNGNLGISLTSLNYIVVYPPPVATFTTEIDMLNVTFTTTSSNVNTYFWDFGDGQTSMEANPTHNYDEPGMYQVSLTITNECGNEIITDEVEVTLALPDVSFIAENATTGCAPLVVQFLNQSSNADSYEWTFPGGIPATSVEENPIVTFSTPGIYTPQLTAVNAAGGNSVAIMDYIEVYPSPTGSFTIEEIDMLNVSFTSVGENIESYFWDFGDGQTSTEANPTHNYDEPGMYQVSLTITNECGNEIITDEIEVILALPDVSFIAENATAGCAPLVVQFLNQSSNADSYEWTFPGGIPATSVEENPIVTFSTPGIYTPQLTAVNAAGGNSVAIMDYIEVYPSPTGSFTIEEIDMLNVSFTSVGENIESYFWDFGDGQTSTEANPSHNYDEPGMYQVSLTITNECGDEVITDEVEVTLALPDVSFIAENATAGCAPLVVQFLNQSSNADSYEWTFPGGIPATSVEENPIVTFSTPGIYTPQLTAVNAAGGNSVAIMDYIEVYPSPTGSFTIEEIDMLNVSFTSVGENIESYFWDFGDGQTSTEANPSHIYDESGTYQVSLTISNECGELVLTEEIRLIIDAIDEQKQELVFKLFPNPNDGVFWIQWNADIGLNDGNLMLFNALGEEVYEMPIAFNEGNGRMLVDLTLPAGIYFAVLKMNESNGLLGRLIIQ